MASPRKKKMAKYMIEDLLTIAKKQLIALNPCLDSKAVLQKIAQEYADVQKEILIKHFPQDDMKILAKYKKAFLQQTFDLPYSSEHGQLGLMLPEYWRWNFTDEEFEKIKANMQIWLMKKNRRLTKSLSSS